MEFVCSVQYPKEFNSVNLTGIYMMGKFNYVRKGLLTVNVEQGVNMYVGLVVLGQVSELGTA